ncbi:MAG: ATP--guanido phosphotransferase [Defluviitaleaceae bacterium]|nr:ATP--guanido phosphotransferase [Defluviitaleaceae bacterium]
MYTTWYEDIRADTGQIVSSRVRLARNLQDYHFPRKITREQARELVAQAQEAAHAASGQTGRLDYTDVAALPDIMKVAMLERHIISAEMLHRSVCGLLATGDGSLAIMINEEDHIRIQSFGTGDGIDAAFETAERTDNALEQVLDYAFSKELGYLTSCPSNTGTGLRASFMLHLPLLERNNQIRNILSALTKFGMTIRGVFGEGSESLGSCYQISNQVTLGKSEQEIIESLKNITAQICEKEHSLLHKALERERHDILDNVYRSHALLGSCRRIGAKEAMSLLSNVRLGFAADILDMPRPNKSLLSIMMNIRDANIQIMCSCNSTEPKDVCRANYLRSVFGSI